MLIIGKIFGLALLAALHFGCEGEKFKASGASGGKDAVSLTCKTAGNQAPKTVRADFGNKAVIDAQLCPSIDNTAAVPLQVVFVIDFSGSMNIADKKQSGQCDRLAAAQVAINNYLAYMPTPNAVQFSVVSFEADSRVLASAVNGDAVNQGLLANADNFCQAIPNKTKASNTNYEAAFRETLNLLSSKTNAQKKVYFLSDGRPSRGSSYVESEDLTAREQSANAVRDARVYFEKLQKLPLTEIFALYLDWQNAGETEKGDFDISPFDLMGQITGNPGNVKVVSESSQLPVVIKEVTPDINKVVRAQDILVEIRAEGYKPRRFGADPESFQTDPSEQVAPVSFRTLPMQLFGRPGQIVRNQVIVSALDARFAPVVFYIDWDQTNSP